MDTDTIDLLIVISAVLTVVYIILRVSMRKRKNEDSKVNTLHASVNESQDKDKQAAREMMERRSGKKMEE